LYHKVEPVDSAVILFDIIGYAVYMYM